MFISIISPSFWTIFNNGSEFVHDPEVLDNEKKKHQEAGIYFLVMYFHSFENFYQQFGSNNGLSAKGVAGFSLHISDYVEYRTNEYRIL